MFFLRLIRQNNLLRLLISALFLYLTRCSYTAGKTAQPSEINRGSPVFKIREKNRYFNVRTESPIRPALKPRNFRTVGNHFGMAKTVHPKVIPTEKPFTVLPLSELNWSKHTGNPQSSGTLRPRAVSPTIGTLPPQSSFQPTLQPKATQRPDHQFNLAPKATLQPNHQFNLAPQDNIQQPNNKIQQPSNGIEQPYSFFSLGPTTGGNSVPVANLEQTLLNLTNQFRAQRGLAQLTWHPDWAPIAREHSHNMASRRAPFGHDGVEQRFGRMGRLLKSAENVAMNSHVSDPAVTAMQGWINSQGHLENLVGDYSHIAIGAAQNGNEYYFTQLFGRLPM